MERDYVVAGNPGLSPRARNMVVPTRPLTSDETESLVGSMVKFYGSPTTWMIWSVFPLSGTHTGLVHLDDSPTMFHARPNGPAPLGPADRAVEGLEIIEVLDDAGVDEFERVRDEARDGLPGLAVPGATPLDARSLNKAHRMWIGKVDGVTVGTAASYVDSGVNMVKYVATLPNYRRRGIAAAMSAHAVRSAVQPAVLDADPGADLLYEQLGFSVTGRVQLWGFVPGL